MSTSKPAPSPGSSPRVRPRQARTGPATSQPGASKGKRSGTTGQTSPGTGTPDLCPWCGRKHNGGPEFCTDTPTPGKTDLARSRTEHRHPSPKFGVRYFRLGEGYHDIASAKAELEDYKDILFGRVDPPLDAGPLTLMECAEAFHARAKEIEMELLELEADGAIVRNSRPYKFRTGYLRSFIELTSKTVDLGSRRLTYWREQHP